MLIGKHLNMKTNVLVTDGSAPIGHGLGPQLEARDVLWVLDNEVRAPLDLREKALMMAGHILEMTGKVKKGKGLKRAQHILESGKAYDKMIEMIRAQRGKKPQPERLHRARFTFDVKAPSSGKLKHINNSILSKIARIAGAPLDQGAGIYMYHSLGSPVRRGDIIYTVYSNNPRRLGYAETVVKSTKGIKITS